MRPRSGLPNQRRLAARATPDAVRPARGHLGGHGSFRGRVDPAPHREGSTRPLARRTAAPPSPVTIAVIVRTLFGTKRGFTMQRRASARGRGTSRSEHVRGDRPGPDHDDSPMRAIESSSAFRRRETRSCGTSPRRPPMRGRKCSRPGSSPLITVDHVKTRRCG
jgi:hypothetical protein